MFNILFIDPTRDQQLVLIFFSQKKIYKLKKKYISPMSNNLIKTIDRFCKKIKVKPKQWQGIVVVNGPGKFSSLRSAVTLANTLAWDLGIPIIGLKTGQLKEATALDILIKSQLKNYKLKFIKPYYSKEPNITKPSISF